MKYACIICVILSSFLALVDCRAAPRDCHDKFHNCETWKRSGFCGANTHAFYLRNGCAKTCGFCKSNIPLTHNLHAVQDAPLPVHKIDPKEHLGAVTASHKQNTAASVGSLHHQKLHAPPQVPQRQRTSDESGKEKPECMDRFVTQTCKNWKDGNICMDDRYRKYLTYGCAMTCRFCNCRDTYRENPYCAEWKSRGFCETYKDQLESYCPKTCGFCINAEYVETPSLTQNATATVSPSQNSTAKPTPPQNSTTKPIPPQNSTAKPPSPQDSTAKNPDLSMKSVEEIIDGQPKEFAETGNLNTKRGLPLVPEENSPLWSVNADPRLTMPQPQQYDDMGGAVKRPLEDGTYYTPAKTNEKFEYFTEHYSPDPYVAAAQREEWMNSSNGVSPTPQLSRKSKKPEVKEEKEVVKELKKSNVRQNKHAHKSPKH